MQRSVAYNLGFATVICVVCAVFVSSAAVSLRSRQEVNARLDMARSVLVAAGLAGDTEELTREEIEARFASIERVVIDLETGEETDIDPATFDQQRAASQQSTSDVAPPNPAGVQRLPHQALVYKLVDDQGNLEALILPVHGVGLWSTLYGFLALESDLRTIRGITFYEHGETPGLGGEVDNPRWKALWPGRKALDEQYQPEITVIKGQAGPPSEDPYRVDGLSGATITSRGVTNLLHFWLGENGYSPYLERLRQQSEEA